MSEQATWTGESGMSYKYGTWELPVSFKPGQGGNYIFAKQSLSGEWVPIYIGQGNEPTGCNVKEGG